MKKAPFIVALVLTFVAEAVIIFLFLGRISDATQDTVAINDVKYSVSENFGNESAYPKTLSYAVIDMNGELLFATDDSVHRSVHEAIKYSDTILDIDVDGETVGRIIFRNPTTEIQRANKSKLVIAFTAISFLQLMLVFFFFLYLKRNITDPFKEMNSFAKRVAQGNLDLPLSMDKQHVFGEFTESFDLMRHELKKSKEAEKRANDEKKEMVAKLSHDIKTPVASIKSASEVGFALSKEEKAKMYFAQINEKADQISTLTDNLFNSSIQDITEISVNPAEVDIRLLQNMIKASDYKHRTNNFTLPEGRVFIDKLRLQQAFDNIFMNSYKYAETKIEVSAALQGDYLMIEIRDFGPGIPKEDLPLITEKYKRGSNAGEKDGAGLGLYLTDYYLDRMDGKLLLENKNPGLSVLFGLRLVPDSI